MDQLSDILLEFGFTKQEAATYIFLLTRGPSVASLIAKNAEIERSRCYTVIKNLVQRGVLNQVVRNRLTYFSAIDPQIIINKFIHRQNFLTQKVQLAQEQLRDFAMHEGRDVEGPKVMCYSSLEGINNILEDVLVSQPRELLGYVSKNFNDYLAAYNLNYGKKRAQRNISAKVIYPIKNIDQINHEPDLEVKRDSRILPEIFDIGIAILVYQNNSVLISIKEQFGLVIESPNIATAQTRLFDFIWKFAKKNV